jgi:hypothetical protein
VNGNNDQDTIHGTATDIDGLTTEAAVNASISSIVNGLVEAVSIEFAHPSDVSATETDLAGTIQSVTQPIIPTDQSEASSTSAPGTQSPEQPETSATPELVDGAAAGSSAAGIEEPPQAAAGTSAAPSAPPSWMSDAAAWVNNSAEGQRSEAIAALLRTLGVTLAPTADMAVPAIEVPAVEETASRTDELESSVAAPSVVESVAPPPELGGSAKDPVAVSSEALMAALESLSVAAASPTVPPPSAKGSDFSALFTRLGLAVDTASEVGAAPARCHPRLWPTPLPLPPPGEEATASRLASLLRGGASPAAPNGTPAPGRPRPLNPPI